MLKLFIMVRYNVVFRTVIVSTVRLHGMQRTVWQRPVRPSVCLSNPCVVTKRQKLVHTFLYHMKERLS